MSSPSIKFNTLCTHIHARDWFQGRRSAKWSSDRYDQTTIFRPLRVLDNDVKRRNDESMWMNNNNKTTKFASPFVFTLSVLFQKMQDEFGMISSLMIRFVLFATYVALLCLRRLIQYRVYALRTHTHVSFSGEIVSS